MCGYTWWASWSALAFHAFVAGQTLSARAPRGALRCSRLRRCVASRALLSFVAYRSRARHLQGVSEGVRGELTSGALETRGAMQVIFSASWSCTRWEWTRNRCNQSQQSNAVKYSIRIRTRDGGRVAPALLALLA